MKMDRMIAAHGDRVSGDAEGVVSGFGWLNGSRCVFVSVPNKPATPTQARQIIRMLRLAEQVGSPFAVEVSAESDDSPVAPENIVAQTELERELEAAKVPLALIARSEPRLVVNRWLFDAALNDAKELPRILKELGALSPEALWARRSGAGAE